MPILRPDNQLLTTSENTGSLQPPQAEILLPGAPGSAHRTESGLLLTGPAVQRNEIIKPEKQLEVLVAENADKRYTRRNKVGEATEQLEQVARRFWEMDGDSSLEDFTQTATQTSLELAEKLANSLHTVLDSKLLPAEEINEIASILIKVFLKEVFSIRRALMLKEINVVSEASMTIDRLIKVLTSEKALRKRELSGTRKLLYSAIDQFELNGVQAARVLSAIIAAKDVNNGQPVDDVSTDHIKCKDNPLALRALLILHKQETATGDNADVDEVKKAIENYQGEYTEMWQQAMDLRENPAELIPFLRKQTRKFPAMYNPWQNNNEEKQTIGLELEMPFYHYDKRKAESSDPHRDRPATKLISDTVTGVGIYGNASSAVRAQRFSIGRDGYGSPELRTSDNAGDLIWRPAYALQIVNLARITDAVTTYKPISDQGLTSTVHINVGRSQEFSGAGFLPHKQRRNGHGSAYRNEHRNNIIPYWGYSFNATKLIDLMHVYLSASKPAEALNPDDFDYSTEAINDKDYIAKFFAAMLGDLSVPKSMQGLMAFIDLLQNDIMSTKPIILYLAEKYATQINLLPFIRVYAKYWNVEEIISKIPGAPVPVFVFEFLAQAGKYEECIRMSRFASPADAQAIGQILLDINPAWLQNNFSRVSRHITQLIEEAYKTGQSNPDGLLDLFALYGNLEDIIYLESRARIPVWFINRLIELKKYAQVIAAANFDSPLATELGSPQKLVEFIATAILTALTECPQDTEFHLAMNILPTKLFDLVYYVNKSEPRIMVYRHIAPILDFLANPVGVSKLAALVELSKLMAQESDIKIEDHLNYSIRNYPIEEMNIPAEVFANIITSGSEGLMKQPHLLNLRSLFHRYTIYLNSDEKKLEFIELAAISSTENYWPAELDALSLYSQALDFLLEFPAQWWIDNYSQHKQMFMKLFKHPRKSEDNTTKVQVLFERITSTLNAPESARIFVDAGIDIPYTIAIELLRLGHHEDFISLLNKLDPKDLGTAVWQFLESDEAPVEVITYLYSEQGFIDYFLDDDTAPIEFTITLLESVVHRFPERNPENIPALVNMLASHATKSPENYLALLGRISEIFTPEVIVLLQNQVLLNIRNSSTLPLLITEEMVRAYFFHSVNGKTLREKDVAKTRGINNLNYMEEAIKERLLVELAKLVNEKPLEFFDLVTGDGIDRSHNYDVVSLFEKSDFGSKIDILHVTNVIADRVIEKHGYINIPSSETSVLYYLQLYISNNNLEIPFELTSKLLQIRPEGMMDILKFTNRPQEILEELIWQSPNDAIRLKRAKVIAYRIEKFELDLEFRTALFNILDCREGRHSLTNKLLSFTDVPDFEERLRSLLGKLHNIYETISIFKTLKNTQWREIAFSALEAEINNPQEEYSVRSFAEKFYEYTDGLNNAEINRIVTVLKNRGFTPILPDSEEAKAGLQKKRERRNRRRGHTIWGTY